MKIFWENFSMPRCPRCLLGHLKGRKLSWHVQDCGLNPQPNDEWMNWNKQANSQQAVQLYLRLFRFTDSQVICCGTWRLCYLWWDNSVEEESVEQLHICEFPSVFSLCLYYSTWLCLCCLNPNLLALLSLRKESTSPTALAGHPLLKGALATVR